MHTPGPWTVNNPKGEAEFTDVHILHNGKNPNGIIAAVNLAHGGSKAPWIGEANARLIAAAPDLLEALKALYNATPGPTLPDSDRAHAFRLARAAFAKVEGDA